MNSAQITWTGFASLAAISLLVTGRMAYVTLRPPEHRPGIFLLGAVFFFALAFVLSHMTALSIIDGIIDVESRQFGHVYASRYSNPWKFWLLIVMEYGAGLMFASYAVAGILLCGQKHPHRPK